MDKAKRLKEFYSFAPIFAWVNLTLGKEIEAYSSRWQKAKMVEIPESEMAVNCIVNCLIDPQCEGSQEIIDMIVKTRESKKYYTLGQRGTEIVISLSRRTP